jgi:hypothetical protein
VIRRDASFDQHIVPIEKGIEKLYHVRSMDQETLAEEEKRMRRLRWIVDLNQAVLMQADLTLREAFDIIKGTKQAALALFPDKGDVFDLVYAPRFKRIIRERFVIPGGLSLKER